jgi:hypothetical protein
MLSFLGGGMKFWTILRSAGWISAVGGYVYAVICIYQTSSHYARASVAGSKVYVTVNCVGDCIQQKAASQTTVFVVTILGAIVLLSVMCGIYRYMKPSLGRVTELKAQ